MLNDMIGKNMNVLIVDDEKLARDRLKRMISRVDGYLVVGEANNGEEAIKQTYETNPDIVLMDVHMPGMDGLNAAGQLAKLSIPPAVIFCTAYEEHAIHAFETRAAGYLLKPVRQKDLERVLEAIKRANRAQLATLVQQDDVRSAEQNTGRSYISAKTRRGIELIAIEDIRYFMADHKYVTVRHKNGEVLIDDTLRELEIEFSDRFIRIHRNALISKVHIEGLERDKSGHYYANLRDIDERLTVSRRHVSTLRKLMQAL